MSIMRPFCLSIAGFDPSGGAGLMADTKVFECLKVQGLGVVSALTFQSHSEFLGVKWSTNYELEQQILPLKNYPVKVAKIGLVASFEQLKWLVMFLKENFDELFIVWDPILKASAGFQFHNELSLPNWITKNIHLITPNWMEYKQLGLDENDVTQCALLVKGGHRVHKVGTDTLFVGSTKYDIEGELFENKIDKHGTGCVLSAAIAAYLAKGESVYEACVNAKRYVEQFIQSNQTKLGYHTCIKQ